MARFTGVCLLTGDVTRLASFYDMILQTSSTGDTSHAEVHTDGATLAIFSLTGMERLAPGSTAGYGTGDHLLEFQVPDIDQEHARLVGAGVPVVKPPTTYPWGRRAAWFRDPDGNMVNLYSVAPTADTSHAGVTE